MRSGHHRPPLFFGLLLVLHLTIPGPVRAWEVSDGFKIASAFLTNLAIHETAHFMVANQAGAEGNHLQFFTGEGGNFFFGLSTVEEIDDRARLSYNLAGEVATSYTFEWALSHYRKRPTLYNKALLFFSGTDFLWYSVYAFYLSPDQNRMFDPIGIAKDTGLSYEIICGIAFTQSALNAIRVMTGQDRVVPYFKLEGERAGFGVMIRF